VDGQVWDLRRPERAAPILQVRLVEKHKDTPRRMMVWDDVVFSFAAIKTKLKHLYSSSHYS